MPIATGSIASRCTTRPGRPHTRQRTEHRRFRSARIVRCGGINNPGLLADPNNYAFTYRGFDHAERADRKPRCNTTSNMTSRAARCCKSCASVRYADSTVDLRGTWNAYCLLPTGPSQTARPCWHSLRSGFTHRVTMGGPSALFDGKTLPEQDRYPSFATGSGLFDRHRKTEALFGGTSKNRAFTGRPQSPDRAQRRQVRDGGLRDRDRRAKDRQYRACVVRTKTGSGDGLQQR